MSHGLNCWNYMMDFILVGAPASFQHGEAAVKFVLDCLLVLPVKSCSVLANQVLIFSIHFENLNYEHPCPL